jgi:hypothetical protein
MERIDHDSPYVSHQWCSLHLCVYVCVVGQFGVGVSACAYIFVRAPSVSLPLSRVSIAVYIYIYIPWCKCTHTHTYIYTHTHTHVHTTHTHTHTFSLSPHTHSLSLFSCSSPPPRSAHSSGAGFVCIICYDPHQVPTTSIRACARWPTIPLSCNGSPVASKAMWSSSQWTFSPIPLSRTHSLCTCWMTPSSSSLQ